MMVKLLNIAVNMKKITIKIKTRKPKKWLIVDTETMAVYNYSKKRGFFMKKKKKIKKALSKILKAL